MMIHQFNKTDDSVSCDSLVKREPAMLVSPCPLMSTTVRPLEMTATDCRMMRRPVRLLLPLTDSSVRAFFSAHKQQNIDISVANGKKMCNDKN